MSELRDDVIMSILVVLVKKSEKQVLVQHRDNKSWISNPNKFALIAGDGEPGEEPADCAKRELEEETGYVMTSSQFLGDEIITHKDTAHRFVFMAEYDQIQKIECREGQSITFMPIEDAIRSDNFVIDHKPWIEKAAEILHLR